MRGLPSPFNGFRKLGARTVIDQIITATVAPAADAMFDGETVGDITNFATLDSTGNYASSAGTIASVQWLVDGVDRAGSYVLSAGEAIVLRVTDSAANTRDWTIDASVAAVVPAQFGTGDWSLANDGVDVTLTVTTLPDDGGSALTDLEYAVNGGSYTSLGAATTGDYTITAVVTDTVTLRAVNAVGNGTASASKTVPAVSTVPLSLAFTSGTYTDGTNTALADITTVTRTSTAWYMDASGNMQSASTGVARDAHHEYDGVSWDRKLLLETDAATNLCLNFDCSDFNSVTNATFTANSGNSPVGVSTAGLWTENSASGTHTVRTDIDSVTSTGRHTRSWLMKSDGRDHWVVTAGSSRVAGTVGGTSNWSVAIDLSAGTAVEALGRTECGIEDFGGGWYRVWIAFNATSVGVVPMGFGARAVAGGSSVYTGDGTSGVYFAAMQMTAGDYPFMFIPTSGSTITRAAETLSVNAASVPWSTTGMSYVFKGAASWTDNNSVQEVKLLGGYTDASNRIRIALSTAGGNTGRLYPFVSNSGTNEVANGPSDYAVGYRQAISVGVRLTTTDLQAIMDGASGVNETAVGGTLSDLSANALPIGGDGLGYAFNGTVDLIEVWDSDEGAAFLEGETA